MSEEYGDCRQGIEALDKEGYNFKAMKGVGQGDKPSPLEVKDKIYEELRLNWVEKKTSKLWNMKLLQTIPKKKEDPGLQDLRPLMLLEVTRKIWVGLIMTRIGDFCRKWGLVDEAQHAYLRGKGTHTVLPQLLNCMEGARDFKTSMFISSFDMSKAFDSADRNFVIACLVRMHVPAESAVQMIGLDDEEKIFFSPAGSSSG